MEQASGKFKHYHDVGRLRRILLFIQLLPQPIRALYIHLTFLRIIKKHNKRIEVISKDPVLRQEQLMLDKVMNAQVGGCM
jgi:hypothetical protein